VTFQIPELTRAPQSSSPDPCWEILPLEAAMVSPALGQNTSHEPAKDPG